MTRPMFPQGLATPVAECWSPRLGLPTYDMDDYGLKPACVCR